MSGLKPGNDKLEALLLLEVIDMVSVSREQCSDALECEDRCTGFVAGYTAGFEWNVFVRDIPGTSG
jgi:hypothetical protein